MSGFGVFSWLCVLVMVLAMLSAGKVHVITLLCIGALLVFNGREMGIRR